MSLNEKRSRLARAVGQVVCQRCQGTGVEPPHPPEEEIDTGKVDRLLALLDATAARQEAASEAFGQRAGDQRD